MTVVQPGSMSSLADETRWMDAVDQATLVDKGEVTPVELLDAAIERIETTRPAIQRGGHRVVRRRACAAARPAGRTVPRRAVPAQGPVHSFAGQTLSNGNVALKDAAIVDTTDTTLVSRYQGGRAGGRRADEQPGDRQPADDAADGVGTHAQPMGAGPHAGRFERRGGRGGRRRDGAVRQRLGRWREHPHPGVVLRTGRAQAEPGPDLGRARCGRRSGWASSCASATRCATPLACWTRCAARESATR